MIKIGRPRALAAIAAAGMLVPLAVLAATSSDADAHTSLPCERMEDAEWRDACVAASAELNPAYAAWAGVIFGLFFLGTALAGLLIGSEACGLYRRLRERRRRQQRRRQA